MKVIWDACERKETARAPYIVVQVNFEGGEWQQFAINSELDALDLAACFRNMANVVERRVTGEDENDRFLKATKAVLGL